MLLRFFLLDPVLADPFKSSIVQSKSIYRPLRSLPKVKDVADYSTDFVAIFDDHILIPESVNTVRSVAEAKG